MARPRTPSNVLALKGSFAKNPDRGRARENEPVVTPGIGEPPPDMPPEVVACWVELVMLCADGVLSAVDRPFMEYAARVYWMIKQPGPVDLKAGVRFEAIIGKLGMSPADRSKVSVSKPPDAIEDPHAEF